MEPGRSDALGTADASLRALVEDGLSWRVLLIFASNIAALAVAALVTALLSWMTDFFAALGSLRWMSGGHVRVNHDRLACCSPSLQFWQVQTQRDSIVVLHPVKLFRTSIAQNIGRQEMALLACCGRHAAAHRLSSNRRTVKSRKPAKSTLTRSPGWTGKQPTQEPVVTAVPAAAGLPWWARRCSQAGNSQVGSFSE